ncbi:MAG: hypothetical protein VX444_09915 [Pseudomonadota bacterium]|nr:hypothetical protein [Pseudomonadota bacterium]
MTEIADLENRLSAALDRIAKGIDQLDAAPVAEASSESLEDQSVIQDQAARIVELETALEAEKTAKAALEAELAAATSVKPDAPSESADIESVNRAHEEELEYMRSVANAEREAWKGLNSRLVRLRRTNRLMRNNAAQIRKAAAENVVDAGAINASLEAELEALRATHEVERAETDVILKTLQPLLGDPTFDAAETEEAV